MVGVSFCIKEMILLIFLYFAGGNRALTVAANSQEEKDRWKEDLQNAIQQARDKTDAKITYLSLKSCSKFKVSNLFQL